MLLTPDMAKTDYWWLKWAGYWDHFSFHQMTSRCWQPMTERFFLEEMGCRIRFRDGSKPQKLARALREARQYHESHELGKSLRTPVRGSRGII